MRILFGNKYFYLRGGSETVFFQERAFCKERGYDVIDFSTKDQKNLFSEYTQFFIPNIDFRYLEGGRDKIRNAFNFIHSKEAVHQLNVLIKKEKPQLAHLHNIYHQLTPAIIPVLKKAGIKVLLTMHDYKLLCPKYTLLNNGKICEKCRGKFFFHALTSRCGHSFSGSLFFAAEAYWHALKCSYDMVDYFLAPSLFMAEKVQQYRVPVERVLLLRNGIDTHAYEPSYRDDGYALYFGRLSSEKGISTLLKAHDILGGKIPLKIVGNGPLENALKQDSLSAEFTGYKSGHSLKTIIQNASFIIVPSEWYENCSMVVLESMAYGKPVIGSNIGGIPEQIEDNITGLLFETGNEKDLSEKINLLFSNSDLRKKMGKAAREKLEKEYSLKRHFEELEKIYFKTLEGTL